MRSMSYYIYPVSGWCNLATRSSLLPGDQIPIEENRDPQSPPETLTQLTSKLRSSVSIDWFTMDMDPTCSAEQSDRGHWRRNRHRQSYSSLPLGKKRPVLFQSRREARFLCPGCHKAGHNHVGDNRPNRERSICPTSLLERFLSLTSLARQLSGSYRMPPLTSRGRR